MTSWTVVADAASISESTSQTALTDLCQSYWRPLYIYLTRSGVEHHKAEDLVQSFFAKFLAGELVSRADEKRGRFRSYLIRSLKNYQIDQYHQENTLKRGRDVIFVSADSVLEIESKVGDGDDLDMVFDKSWAFSVLENVLELLKQEFHTPEKQTIYEALKEHLFDRGQPYEELAKELGMGIRAVTMTVYRMRKRYGELLCREVSRLIDDPADLESEISYLIRVIADSQSSSK